VIPDTSSHLGARKYWEIIADNLSKARWELGLRFSNRFSPGNRCWIADAHRDEGKLFVVHADEKLTVFLELELAIRPGQKRPGDRAERVK
jgi:hypothetical protein